MILLSSIITKAALFVLYVQAALDIVWVLHQAVGLKPNAARYVIKSYILAKCIPNLSLLNEGKESLIISDVYNNSQSAGERT